MFPFVVSVVSNLPDYDWTIQASGPAYCSCHRIAMCAQAVTVMSEASCLYQYCYNCQ